MISYHGGSFYNKCKHCGRMKLMGMRCNSCMYTDPEEHRPDDPTCYCIECIPSPKDDNATDTREAEPVENGPDLGGEAG